MFKIINFIKNKSHKEIYFSLFLSLTWFFLWGSINVEPKWIKFFGENFIGTINSVRISIPLILSVITFGIIFLLIKMKVVKIDGLNNIIFIFYIYFLFQIFGLLFNKNVDFSLGNNFLIILGIGTINVFFIMKIFSYQNYSKLLLFFTFFFCLIFISFIVYLNFFKLTEYLAFSTFYSISRPNDILFGSAYPRSTGLSRICAILAIILFALYMSLRGNKFSYKFIIFILLTFFSVFIWGFQSRGTILSFSVSIILSILFFGYGIKERLINICLILILPVLIFNQISQIAKNYFFNKYLDDSKIVIDKNADIDDIKNSIIENLKINEGDELKAFKKTR